MPVQLGLHSDFFLWSCLRKCVMECSYETSAGYFDHREALRQDRKIGIAFIKEVCETEYLNKH